MTLRLRLIEGWHKAYRLWSVRLMAVAAFLQVIPAEGLLYVFNLIPADLQVFVPGRSLVFAVLAVTAIIARIIPQPKAQEAMEDAK